MGSLTLEVRLALLEVGGHRFTKVVGKKEGRVQTAM